MNVLVADKFEKLGLDGLAAIGCKVTNAPEVPSDGLAASVNDAKADVLVVRSKKVPAAAIQQMRGMRLIIRAGAGYDNIDLNAAKAAGVAVANCPGMNAIAVAELAMGHLLNLDRRIPEQTIAAREGRWDKKEFGKVGVAGARGLKGSTLGVIGCGAIGRAVIKRALAFEMRVIAWSRSITKDHARDLGAEWGGNDTPALYAMAATCDAISIHLPGASDTKHLIGQEFLSRMKPGAYLINTSRGSVVDEAALREAMKAKGIRAGLDVYENQPADPQGPWMCETAKLAGVSMTHHSGAGTEQAQNAVAEEVVRIVGVFQQSGRVENRVA
jgi:D-3-phosphoglycerate dehydrogenase